MLAAAALPPDGNLIANITHFARALRNAGLPVGPGWVTDATRAVKAAGFISKPDFHRVLHACFVSHLEHRQVYAQIFWLYWRDPNFLEHMPSAIKSAQDDHHATIAERAEEALLEEAEADVPEAFQPKGAKIKLDAVSIAEGAGWSPVHSLKFGTRLTIIIRNLVHRDVDVVMARTGAEAQALARPEDVKEKTRLTQMMDN